MDLLSRALLRDMDEAVAKAVELLEPGLGAIVCPQPECSRFLRGHGLPAVSPAESNWLDAIDAGSDVLLFDEAQRLAGDLLSLGVTACFSAWTPPPFRYVSEWMNSRIVFLPSVLVSDLLLMLADTATRVECGPTAHPMALRAPAPRVVVR